MKTNRYAYASFTAAVLCLLGGTVIAGCGDGKTPPARAYITFLVGRVDVIPAGREAREAVLKDALVSGDAVRTGLNSHAMLQLGDRAVIRVQPGSHVEMRDIFSAGRAGLYLDRGEVLAKISRLQRGESFSVKTPVSVAAVRGTVFSVRYAEEKSTVAVKEGSVSVSVPREEPAEAGEKEAGKEAPPREETVVETGKTAVVSAPVMKTAAAKPVIEVRPISQVEALTMEKVEIVPLVPGIEKAAVEEIREMQAPAVENERRLDAEIREKADEERLARMVASPPKSIEEIKEAFQRIDEITLFNERVIRGAIISRGPQYRVLTTDGTVTVPEKQIRTIKVIR